MDNLDVESGKISTQAKLELNENIANLLPIKKIVIKNSNIGSGSNMTTKQTDVNISPTISIQPEKKQSFLKRFWNLIKGKH